MSQMPKAVMNTALEILGFDPKSTKEEMFETQMTPSMAAYILRNHNKANRKFVKAQQNAIKKSVDTFGWLFDGGTCAFNTDGNLTEYQHRLQEIADGNMTRTVWVATGVKKDTFEKELAQIKLERKLFDKAQMELTAKDRMRELKLWSQLKDELVKQDPNFDKENVDTHQKESLPKRLLKTFQFF